MNIWTAKVEEPDGTVHIVNSQHLIGVLASIKPDVDKGHHITLKREPIRKAA